MKSSFHFTKCAISIYLLLIVSSSDIFSQDIFLSFAGTGASTTVASVRIENLVQNTSKEINGTDILHLMGTITGIDPLSPNKDKISFSPNPMTDYTSMMIELATAGETFITLFDNSGRKIADKKNILSKGQHIFRIEGLNEGIYIARISTPIYTYSGKFFCTGKQPGTARITYENTVESADIEKSFSTGSKGDVVMQYNTGDLLKITAISGNYSTVITDIPATSKTITFTFAECMTGDNINYPVVQIGSQLWMAENLRSTLFNDGMAIENVTDDFIWSGLATPAYCWYDNQISNKNTYGALYNWFVVGSGKICPLGWHVPSDAEWGTLITYLGGETLAGGKLKETTAAHWLSTNLNVSNSTGFTARPGGHRYYAGPFGNITWDGFWWSTDEGPATYGWYMNMNHGYNTVSRSNYYKKNGASIRCLKN